MTEPNAQGFHIFTDEPACRAWMDDARIEGGEDPLVVAVFTPENMIPKPKNWASIDKSRTLEFRRLVDSSMAQARGRDGEEYGGMKYFGFMQNGEMVAGAVQWKKGTMTWPDTTKEPTPAQRARWAARDGAAAEGGAHTDGKPAPTPPAAPQPSGFAAEAAALGAFVSTPASSPKLLQSMVDLSRAQQAGSGFPMNAFKMDMDRAIVSHPDAPPVMLVLKDGKIALKKLA